MASSFEMYKSLIQNKDYWSFNHGYASHKIIPVKYDIGRGLFHFVLLTNNSSNPKIGFINKVKLFYWLRKTQKEKYIEMIEEKTKTDEFVNQTVSKYKYLEDIE